MTTQNPQESFFAWLAEALGHALDALRAPDRDLEFLAAATDHADLERRLRMLQQGALPASSSPLHFRH